MIARASRWPGLGANGQEGCPAICSASVGSGNLPWAGLPGKELENTSWGPSLTPTLPRPQTSNSH